MVDKEILREAIIVWLIFAAAVFGAAGIEILFHNITNKIMPFWGSLIISAFIIIFGMIVTYKYRHNIRNKKESITNSTIKRAKHEKQKDF